MKKQLNKAHKCAQLQFHELLSELKGTVKGIASELSLSESFGYQIPLILFSHVFA